jgi:hypothetical protein
MCARAATPRRAKRTGINQAKSHGAGREYRARAAFIVDTPQRLAPAHAQVRAKRRRVCIVCGALYPKKLSGWARSCARNSEI